MIITEKITLSFCIPTYNRISFLKKNLSILVNQVRCFNLSSQISIYVSDNASKDGTGLMLKEFKSQNKDIIFDYVIQEKNIGQDANFITVMNMATGDYSVLMGDDDFLKEDALLYIYKMIIDNSDVGIFVSSVTKVDVNGNCLREKYFVREDIDSLKVNFNNKKEISNYFRLCIDLGGLLSFISSVVYKTSVLSEIKFDNNEFMGYQAFSFLPYWWRYLMAGNTLLYQKKSYINNTAGDSTAYLGIGVSRILIDYRSYISIAQNIIKDSSLQLDFLSVLKIAHSQIGLRTVALRETSKFKKELLPLLKEIDLDSKDANIIVTSLKFKYVFRDMIYCVLPAKLINVVSSFLYQIRKIISRVKVY